MDSKFKPEENPTILDDMVANWWVLMAEYGLQDDETFKKFMLQIQENKPEVHPIKVKGILGLEP